MKSLCTPLAALAVLCATATLPAQTDPRAAALELQQEGRIAEAQAAWRKVIARSPSDAEAYANLGLLEARQEHYREAVADYRKALSLKPSLPGLRMNLGLSLFKAGELREATQTFEGILKSTPASSPDTLRLKTLIGLGHYGTGNYAAAVPYLKAATASDPSNLPFRLALAQSCLWSKQYQCVLDVYHQILTLNAESAEADMLAGEALDEMKNKRGAEEQFRAAVKADPRLPNVHFGLGYLLWSELHYDEAAKEFQAEIANSPNHAQALAYLADCDMKLGHPEDARPLIQKALQLDPKIELAHMDLGIMLNEAGERDGAVRELRSAEQLNPDDQDIHWRLARLYKSMGKNEDAKAEFEKTRNLHRAADQTVFNQLHQAQEKGKPAAMNPNAPLGK